MQKMWVRSLGRGDPLEKETAIHFSILAWEIPWTEEPGGLQSMGSWRVGYDWVTGDTQTLILLGNVICFVWTDISFPLKDCQAPGGRELIWFPMTSSMARDTVQVHGLRQLLCTQQALHQPSQAHNSVKTERNYFCFKVLWVKKVAEDISNHRIRWKSCLYTLLFSTNTHVGWLNSFHNVLGKWPSGLF